MDGDRADFERGGFVVGEFAGGDVTGRLETAGDLAVWNKLLISSETTLALGLLKGSLFQHCTARFQRSSDISGASLSYGRSGLTSSSTTSLTNSS